MYTKEAKNSQNRKNFQIIEMEDFKIRPNDLIEFVEDHHQTQSKDESVYTLEIKRVELNLLSDKAKRAYDAIRRISHDTHETIDFNEVKDI